MSEHESTICAICGGYTSQVIIRRLPAANSEGIPYPLADVPPIRLCPGHPEPVQKHDGRLDKDGDTKVQYGAAYPGERGIYVLDMIDDDPKHHSVYLGPAQALSLLTWLEQERGELQRLAKEQEP